MSTECFDVEIASLDGPVVELMCTTTTAGGANDYATTKSFVLLCLFDAARESSQRCPLVQALGELDFDENANDGQFYSEHVGTFVRSVTLVRREGIVDSPAEWSDRRSASARQLTQSGVPNERLDALLDEKFPRHRFLLRAEMTNAQWLTGIKKGVRFGTTAYDVLYPDSAE